MNDRIKKLAEQVGAVQNVLAMGRHDGVLFTETELERFVELIVRECIDIVKPTDHHEVWAQSYLGGVDGLDLLHSKIKDIKEHFGVEE